ncbi:ABC transporter substrate-binding protein [Thermovibrio sp.]
MFLRFFLLALALFFHPLNSFGKERIVSLSPALSEIVDYLGGDDSLVGVSDFCDDKFCKGKEKVGGIVNPNLEAIFLLKPDLVVCSTMTPERFCKTLKRLGIKTQRFSLISFKDLKEVFRALEKDLGVKEDRFATFKRVLLKKASLLKPCIKGKRVFVALSGKPLYCAGSRSYLGELLKLSGATVVPDGTFGAVSYELLYSLNPELVISFAGCSYFKGFKCLDLSDYKSDFFHLSPRLLRALGVLRKELCR